MTSDQPVGPVVDTTPAARPGPVVLEGRYALIEKLDPGKHGAALWRAVRDDDSLWTYMGYGPFAGEAAFAAGSMSAPRSRDPYSYAVVDRKRGEATGIVTLMEVRPAMRVIEIGNIVYSRRPPAHAGRDRGAVSRRGLRLRHARLPALRVEVQRPQCAVAARGATSGVYLRGGFPAAYDHQGPESRHCMVLHARQRNGRNGRMPSNGGSTLRTSTQTAGSVYGLLAFSGAG